MRSDLFECYIHFFADDPFQDFPGDFTDFVLNFINGFNQIFHSFLLNALTANGAEGEYTII